MHLEKVRHEEFVSPEISSLKANFIAQVSHEFRTPLTIILLSAQLLEIDSQEEYTSEDKLKYIHHIQEAVRKMNNIFNESLENFRETPINCASFSQVLPK